MTLLSIEDMLAALKRKSGDGGDSRGRRPSPPNTRGTPESKGTVGRPQVAPGFVYREQAGDRLLNPATDADLDPMCRYFDCAHILNARTGDRECCAGHSQVGQPTPGRPLRIELPDGRYVGDEALRPDPIEALAAALAPEAPEQLVLAYDEAVLATAGGR